MATSGCMERIFSNPLKKGGEKCGDEDTPVALGSNASS